MDLWEANLFGLPSVRCGDRRVDHFQTRQAALLFAYLVLHPRRHQRDELVDLLWPDADPESGRPRLSQAIWRIRQIFRELRPDSEQELVISDRNTVAVDAAHITSDVGRFQQLLQRSAHLEGTARVEALALAAAIYGDSGGFLVGFYDDWVLQERERLLTNYIAAQEEIASYYEKMGEWKRSLEAAERAVAADPLLEDSHRHWIRLLASSGQPAAALRQYQNLTRLLARELNTEPSSATRALIEEVRRTMEFEPVVFPAQPPSPSQEPSLKTAALAAPLTNFYGRDEILQEIGALLEDRATRLITLLGTGGVGKTRLALELARRVEARRAEPAVAMVSLTDIAQPGEIAEAIAIALTPQREASPMQRIANALTTAPDASPFLLVLDNAEHLAEPLGALVTELLAQIPRLCILVTSQRNLGVSGEHEVTLTPLELPSIQRDSSTGAVSANLAMDNLEDAASVRLFIDRAKSVRPGFPTDSVRLAEIAQICERLEGLPLAIELCAGWAQTLGTRQMLDMLARRFELLVSRRTDIPARHRTLRAAIEYSYIQLTATMQEHLVMLASFRGGWTLAAAADVCMGGSTPLALAMLAQMREHSLIVAEEARVGDGMRYKMLESLRDFAGDQRTMTQIRQHGAAHAGYFARFAGEIVARMRGQEAALWSARLDDELENMRAALEYFISSRDTEKAWAATADVSQAWNAHGRARESHQWIARVLAMDDPSENGDTGEEERLRLQRLRARLLTTHAEALHTLSDYDASIASAEQALAIWRALRDTAGMTQCIGMMGITAMLHDDFDRAQTLLAQALSLSRTLGDSKVIAQTLNDLGRVAMALQDWPAASGWLTEALEIRRQIGEPRGVCSSLNNLGLLNIHQGNPAAARVFLQEASALQKQHHFVWFSVIDGNLAIVERLEGHYAESLRLMNTANTIALAHGERRLLAWSTKEMGHLAVALKQYALGLRLLSCAEAMRVSIGMSFKPTGPQDIERDRATAEQALGVGEAAASWTVGASADPEALLAQAQIDLAEYVRTLSQSVEK